MNHFIVKILSPSNIHRSVQNSNSIENIFPAPEPAITAQFYSQASLVRTSQALLHNVRPLGVVYCDSPLMIKEILIY